MKIEIDNKSGFCFGVVQAIRKAEEQLEEHGKLYVLGDIVHNGAEVARLAEKGLIPISHEQFYQLKDCRVLIRTHGEPPETYEYAKKNNIELVDATCPVVIKLQQRVKKSFDEMNSVNGQLVIFGKHGHAEVQGLLGQTGYQAIIIESKADLDKIDFTRPVTLYTQTTKPLDEFREISEIISSRSGTGVTHETKDTICRQVANRAPHLKEFAARHDVIVFVSGKKSSNGAALHAVCRAVNERSYLVSGPGEIEPEWFRDVKSVGICGATSTPGWQMEAVALKIREFDPENHSR